MAGVFKEKLRYFSSTLNLHHLHIQNEEQGLMEQSKASNSISISQAREDLRSRSCVAILRTCRRHTSNNSRYNMRSKRDEIVVVPTTVNCFYNSIHTGVFQQYSSRRATIFMVAILPTKIYTSTSRGSEHTDGSVSAWRTQLLRQTEKFQTFFFPF